MADALRRKDLAKLKENFEGANDERNRTKSDYFEKYTELENIEAQIDELDLSVMDEDKARHMLGAFTKTVEMLQR